MSRSSHVFAKISFLLAFFGLFLASEAIVPSSETFKYVNQGELGEHYVEYGADYRSLQINTYPFTLCFYNTTPNAFMLGILMGSSSSESVMRWVWEANRGSPVRENAFLALGRDGNLVLADFNGKIAWQTGTGNKGVVGLKLLPNGNLVLYDKKGNFIWQSFDYPTDTLLVGQSLRASSGQNKLVSRLSYEEPVNGLYSFIMEKKHWAMYYQSKNSQKPMLYYSSGDYGYYENTGLLSSLTFYCKPEYSANHAYELEFIYILADPSKPSDSILSRPKYNSTYSMLRVDMDGNLRIYTFEEYVDWGSWDITYILLDRNQGRVENECKLPKRCGALGVCEDSQCVACPTPGGLQGWSKRCAPPVLPPCKGGNGKVDYYKVDGVEHFTSEYVEGNGPMKLAECKNKCNKDCKCLGFFYREESSKCLLVPELGSLIKTSNSSHVGYIKMPQ